MVLFIFVKCIIMLRVKPILQAEEAFSNIVSYAENYGYWFSKKLCKSLQQIFELNNTEQ